jgi:hypothetical protein
VRSCCINGLFACCSAGAAEAGIDPAEWNQVDRQKERPFAAAQESQAAVKIGITERKERAVRASSIQPLGPSFGIASQPLTRAHPFNLNIP